MLSHDCMLHTVISVISTRSSSIVYNKSEEAFTLPTDASVWIAFEECKVLFAVYTFHVHGMFSTIVDFFEIVILRVSHLFES
jgi:hypothetical protein